MHYLRITQHARLCELLQFLRERVEPRPERLHEEELLFLCDAQKRAQFCRVGRDRLLAEDVLARLERRLRVRVVMSVRGADVDCIDALRSALLLA